MMIRALTTCGGGDTGMMADDFKTQINKLTLSKIEDDLYKEDSDVVMPVIRVKHIALPNKGDRWRIFSDDKQVIVIEGIKLNKTERAYLCSLDGVSFLIAQVKAGARSFNGIKLALKQRMRELKAVSGA
jgi:hypothetical protein